MRRLNSFSSGICRIFLLGLFLALLVVGCGHGTKEAGSGEGQVNNQEQEETEMTEEREDIKKTDETKETEETNETEETEETGLDGGEDGAGQDQTGNVTTETGRTAEEEAAEKAAKKAEEEAAELAEGKAAEKAAKKAVEKDAISKIMKMDAGTILTRKDLAGIDKRKLFKSKKISDKVFKRMDGVSFGKDCTTKRSDLRYLRVLHRGFDGKTHIGELVCNKAIDEDLLDIFRELYKEKYPIEKMLLVDEYDGDDELSMEDNNTSCFNFRTVSGSGSLSKHALGRAIDINPLYNPYITSSGYEPYNAGDYVDRSAKNPYKIDEDDLCYELFTEKGFFWGGNWNSVKDYQHFQKE